MQVTDMAENENKNGSTESAHLLELVDISVHYGAVVGLDKVSLAVNKGELVAVMGPQRRGEIDSLEGNHAIGARCRRHGIPARTIARCGDS